VARSKPAENTREFNFPPNSGVLTGWLAVAFGLAGMVWAGTSMHDVVGVRVGLGSALLVVVAYAFMLRPRIKVSDGVLLLVNPLEDVSMPLSVVDRVLVRSTTKVYVGEKKYTAVAVGRKVRHMAGNNRPRPDQIPDLLEEWVYQLVKDSKLEPTPPDAKVRRTPIWWLIVPTCVLLVALVAALLL
jgi:hypothetical protein